MIFTAYQVHGRWTIIKIPVKVKSYSSNVTEIILNISCHTHLNIYMPCTFILQQVKKPTNGFCTHLFFKSSTIVAFGGKFLHWISRLLKVKLKLRKVPTTDFAGK